MGAAARLLLTAVAVLAFVDLVRQPLPSLRWVLAFGLPLLTLAVVLGPYGSNDVWSYAAYGRLMTEHGMNPYSYGPESLGTDPLLQEVSAGWRHVPTVYGPVFTLLSAAMSWLSDGSLIATRLLFQGVEAFALAFTAIALARHVGSSRPAVFLLLNPAVLAMVNGGHNDVLAGCLVALAVVQLRSRSIWSGLALLLAAVLIKLTAAIVVVVVIVWMAQRNLKQAVVAGSVLAAVAFVAYLPFGGPDAIDNLFANSAFTSRASVWSLPVQGLELLVGRKDAAGIATLVMIASALVAVGVAGRRKLALDDRVVVAIVTMLVLSPYVLPWYFGLALPVAAIASRRPATVAVLTSTALLVAYAIPPGETATGVAGALSPIWLPLTLPAYVIFRRPVASHAVPVHTGPKQT